MTPPTRPDATAERRYRVFVEKHESGWIEVSAPTEDIARDRAQDVAMRDFWYPTQSHAMPLKVEIING